MMPLHAATEAESIATAKEIVQTFGGQLKGELKTAMKSSGPIAAINVCHERAPAIAQELSQKYNAVVYRTSLKPRATPAQDWEITVLENFNERQAKGEDIATMDAFRIVKTGEHDRLHYMKAIGTMPVCTTCHGTDIKPEIQAKLNELYPNDQATGYTAGQVRGAFSIQLPM